MEKNSMEKNIDILYGEILSIVLIWDFPLYDDISEIINKMITEHF